MNFQVNFNEQLAAASTLPSSLYTDPLILQLEKEKVFSRTWQLVGREEQLSQPGQFFTATVCDEAILLARGSDRTMRALSNVCRHRAGPVASGEGTCKAFRCGYHGWTYSLDGQLIGTPEFEGVEHFRREDYPLPQFHLDTWLGLLFVNLNPSANPLVESIGELTKSLLPRELSSMRWAARKEWTVECNWKVYVDNYLEGYHIPIVHPGLMRELDYSRYQTATKGVYSAQHAPLREAAPGRLRKGEDASGSDAQFFWIFPNLMLNVYADNFSTNLILPVSHDKTLTVFEWYFRDPENTAVREKIRQTIEFSDEIQREDIAICETVQKGLRSRTYQSGRYSVRRENGVHHFHSLLISSLRQA